MVLMVFMVFMDVIDNEIHHHSKTRFVSSVHHRMEFLWCSKTRVNASRFNRPIAVVGCNIMNAICGFPCAVRCGVERRQPKRIDPQVSKVTGFDHRRHAGKISALPVRSLSSTGQ